jgi:DNA-binding MarR family transcriptional regulator
MPKNMMSADTHEVAQKTLDIIPLVMTVMASEMRSTGTDMLAPSHMRLLGMLSERPYRLTELAEMQAVSAPTMSNTITALEERGWVKRVRSESDRRVVMDEMYRHTRSRIAEFLSVLSPHELELLRDGLTILNNTFITALKHMRHGPPANTD